MMEKPLFNWALSAMLFCFLATGASARQGLPEFTDLIKASSPAVVKINTVDRGNSRPHSQHPGGQQQIPDIFRYLLEPRQMPQRPVRSMGSGFIISEDGYILTNNHVIEGADEIEVRMSDRRDFPATVIGTDPRSDLALLKIEASDLPTLKLAEKSELQVGEWVVAIGSPFGLDFSASAGIVSAIGRSIPTERNENYVPFIQTDVAINPGNSGGPLFNLDGEVVGINSQIYTRSGGSIGLSFAIPSDVAIDVVAQLKSSGRVERGWLGVVIQEVDADLAKSFGLDSSSGALVAQMDPQGPAAQSGLRIGDIILEFNGSDVESSSDLPHLVGAVRPNTKVEVLIAREGKKKEIDVTVGSLGGGSQAKSPPAAEGGPLGIVVTELEDSAKKRWNISGGVVVTSVSPDGPGAKAGLKPGDIVSQLGFSSIATVKDFEAVESKLDENTLYPIRFFRGGRPVFRTITIN